MAEIMHATIKSGATEVTGFIVELGGRKDTEQADIWDMPIVKGISVRRPDGKGSPRQVNAVVKSFNASEIVPFEGKDEAEAIIARIKL
jgi:hypothetical protein